MLDIKIFDPNGIRDISPLLLDDKGHLRTVPASVLADTTTDERALFGVKHAVYGLLTDELVHWLREFIDGRSAIEIGAGTGRLAAALGIPATDSRMQERADIKRYYAAMSQPVIRYGDNVERLDAEEAVKRHKPQVVVASWVTHKYDPKRAKAGGNQEGVREEAIIDAVEAYVFIGNEYVHAGKSIWSLPHDKFHPKWLYSRAHNGTPEFISVWRRR